MSWMTTTTTKTNNNNNNNKQQFEMTLLDEIRRSYERDDCRGLFRRSRDRIDGSAIKRVTRDAAVLLAVFRAPAPNPPESDACIRVWLTRRAKNLRQGGDICLPGGVAEEADGSLVATAVREAGEEIGISPSQIEIVGPLPGLVVRIGDRHGKLFTCITPVLAVITDETFRPRLNADEVASAFHLPLERFLSDESHTTRSWTLSRPGGTDVPMREHCFEDDVADQNDDNCVGQEEGRVVTWGFTARVLIACACVVHSPRRPSFSDDMDEMAGGADGPFDYFDGWISYAEEMLRDRREAETDDDETADDGRTPRNDSKL